MELSNFIYSFIYVLFTTQICYGSPFDNNLKGSGGVQSRLMDLGNGMLVPDANDLMHQAMSATGAIMNTMNNPNRLVPPTSYGIQASAQMYPPTYMEPYVDNSIFSHITIITRLVTSFVNLMVDSVGIIPSSFDIGESNPPFVKLMMIKRASQEVQEYYSRFLTIITQDLVGIDRILSYIPGYSLIKGLLSIPTYVIQKIIQSIQDFSRITIF